MKQQIKIGKTRYTFSLEPDLRRVFRIALARSPYPSQRAFFRETIIKLCKEYAPDDYKEVAENNQNKA